MIDNDNNTNYEYYYRHVFKKIGLPTLIFGLLYTVYGVLRGIVKDGFDISDITKQLLSSLNGAPMYHMWYLSMILGLYFITPVLILARKNWKERDFCIFSVIVFVLILFGKASGRHWSFQVSMSYLGYYLIGWVIHSRRDKNRRLWWILLFVGVILMLVITNMEYNCLMLGVSDSEKEYDFLEYVTPLMAFASIFVFSGFSKMDFRIDCRKVSNRMFYVYLLHGGVNDIVVNIYKLYFPLSKGYFIPILSIIVFAMSYCGAIIVEKILKLFDDKKVTKILDK